MTRDLAQRLEQMAGFLKHGEPEEIAKWETQDQIRGLLREAAAMIGMCGALLGPDELNLKHVEEGTEVTIRTVLQPDEVEDLIPLFAEHA